MTNLENYDKAKENAQNYYKKVGKIKCPALKDSYVHFTSEGFNHLIYKKARSERDKKHQMMRFSLIPKGQEILSKTTTYQEYEESLISVKKKKKKKNVLETVDVKYWGFVAIIRNYRIKVIVRQLGDGNMHFWSIIPAWRTNQYKDVKLVSNSKGNLEED